MQKTLTLTSLFMFVGAAALSFYAVAEQQKETEIKFAFYSSAWGENTDDGLRLVAFNQTLAPIRLNSIELHGSEEATESYTYRRRLRGFLPGAMPIKSSITSTCSQAMNVSIELCSTTGSS